MSVLLHCASAPVSSPALYIGLMSGTSLDGVDGVLASLLPDGRPAAMLATAYVPFSASLRDELLALQSEGVDEIHREAAAANQLAACYAQCVSQLLLQSATPASHVRAVSVHGQTIRHRPECGYTRQTNNPALLAERCGIDVIADFRSRDIAAGGQGAPLVPAFHRALFSAPTETRVVVNIGGIANISILPAADARPTAGFDTGPGNVLLDGWIARHCDQAFDDGGAWASTGTSHPAFLAHLRDEPYFRLPPPKSTGRDLFHMQWLDDKCDSFATLGAADVQATLADLTATTIADAIHAHAADAKTVYVCGGGAYNRHLLQLLERALHARHQTASVLTTDALGVPPNQVEALAFAWLGQRFLQRLPGNLPGVTGARGQRVLGAFYPA